VNFRGHFVSRYARLEGSPPGGITGRETIDDYIRDLAKTVSLCTRPPHLVATGLGALVALKYAERNGVGKMLLINPAPTQELFESLGLGKKKVKDNLKRYVTFSRNGTCTLKREVAKKWLFSGRSPEIHTEFESMSFLNEEPSRLFERAFTGGISVSLGRRKPRLSILGTKKNLLVDKNLNSALSKLLGADKLRLVDKGCQAMSLARDWERYAKLVDSWLR
jgi:pimeloyl-ACP methyl ester carboxylesterase